MTSVYKYCLLCAKGIRDIELNSTHFDINPFIFNNILDVPHLQCSQYIGISYCTYCLVEIKKVQIVYEEIQRLVKLMERRKTEIKFQLKKNTEEFNKNLTKQNEILLKPVVDLRNEIVSELASREFDINKYSTNTTTTLPVNENTSMTQRHVDDDTDTALCSSDSTVYDIKSVSILKWEYNGSETETIHCSYGGSLEKPVPLNDLQTTFEEISNPMGDPHNDKPVRSIPFVDFPSCEFEDEGKILPDVHDTTADEYSKMSNQQSFLESLSELQTSQFEELTKTFLCGVCGIFFESYNLLEEHDKLHSNINQASKHSNKIIKTTTQRVENKSLSLHTEIYDDVECEIICDSNILKNQSPPTHPDQTILTKLKSSDPIKCKECGKMLCNSYGLRNHAWRFHNSQPGARNQCTLCMRDFRTKGELTGHMINHSDVRNYHCQLCPLTFKTNSNLTRHQKVHTGERPFPCNFCTKRFSHSFDLTKHERIHTGETPYQCNFCELKFRQKSQVSKHELVHKEMIDEYSSDLK